jgi:uncharacterized SAM-binding protein YcdF (DUF218 family)
MNNEVLNAARTLWEWLPVSDPIPAEPVDMIFVLGNKSDALPGEAAMLFKKKLAPLIVLSGGRGRITKNDPLTEVERYMRVLRQENIPGGVIISDDKSTNTGENIAFSKSLLEEKGLVFTSGIAVTTTMLSMRHKALLKKQWPEIKWCVRTPEPVPFDTRMTMQNPEEFFDLMVGEVTRLQYYPATGFMDAIAIPDTITEAVKVLIKAGYIKYRVESE